MSSQTPHKGKNMPQVEFGFKEIISEKPIDEIWKRLRLMTDVPRVTKYIRDIHKVPESSPDANQRKQASQLANCIRQAEEYFRAGESVSLATRPTLLYYGGIALTRALVLLRLDGTHSFDALRQADRHNHHGLEFDRGPMKKVLKFDSTESFLNSIQCTINCLRKSVQEASITDVIENTPRGRSGSPTKRIPWGHFGLFYQCLFSPSFRCPTEIHESTKASFLRHTRTNPSHDILDIEELLDKRFSAWDLLGQFPELAFKSQSKSLCRGSVHVRVVRNFQAAMGGPPVLSKTTEEHDFFLDGIDSDSKESYLAFLRVKNPRIILTDDHGHNIHMSLKMEALADGPLDRGYYPDVMEDIAGQHFFILNPSSHLVEPAAHLVLLFCLSMLSRYYPDIWMREINTNVEVAELFDSFLNTVQRKLPNLILDQLTLQRHHVHS